MGCVSKVVSLFFEVVCQFDLLSVFFFQPLNEVLRWSFMEAFLMVDGTVRGFVEVLIFLV